MYDEGDSVRNDSQPLNICSACLCKTRKIFPLGEYAGIFNRIIYFSTEDSQHAKLCWECFAVLRKVKVFETKCYVAQRILRTKWENHQPPRCLSTLVMTPVKIDIHFGDELSETNHGFKFEAKPLVNDRNTSHNDDDYKNYIHSNEVYYCTSFGDDRNDSKSDEFYEFFDRNKIENDYLDHIIEEPVLNGGEDNKNEAVIKTEEAKLSTEECNGLTSKFNTNNDSIDFKEEIKGYLINKSSKFKLNKDAKSVRRKGLRKKDLEEHFRIVSVKTKDMKRFRSKCKIDISELEFWREEERSIDFYTDKPYKCHNCISSFSTAKKKYEHDKKYHDKASGVYSCDICTSQFVSKHALAVHVSKHYYLHRCTLCAFRCVSRHVIKLHLRRHKRLVACAHCDGCFSNVGLFCKHFKANHSVFICDHCGKRCRTKYTLEKHIRHHSEKNICLICNKVYASRNSLRNHSEMKHKETSSEMAYCVKCDKQFPNVPLYKRHVQSSKAHAAERDADRNKKQVSCPICGNIYSRKTYMMNHYRHVHMKQSKHYCTDCDRHFLNRTRYVEHRKYHHEGETKAKNKMCNICGRGFAANRTLINHIRTHSGERPYECQYCDAKFTQKHGMLSHIKYIHMKNKRRGFQ